MLFKIVFTGISLCLINVFLKKQSSEFVLPVEIVFVCLSALLLIEYIDKIFSGLSELTDTAGYSEEFYSSAVKGVGICLITKFSSDICDENGNKTIGSIIEFTGRIILALITLPYIESILHIALGFTK